MKKSVLSVVLGILLVFCLSFGAFASGDIVYEQEGDSNTYFVSADIATGAVSTDKLYIGTVSDYLGDAADGSTTVFENGEAIHPNDIIVMNDKVGIVISVGTRNPWGYPSGSVLDAGRLTVKDGAANLEAGNVTFGRDTIWSIEFLVNNWDAWSPGNAGQIKYEIVNYDFDAKAEVESGGLKAVRVTRDYVLDGNDLDIMTYYAIAPGEEFVYMYTAVKNNDTKASAKLNNTFSMTNKGDDGGYMATFDDGDTGLNASITYGETEANTFATSVLVPGDNNGHPVTYVTGGAGYKDIYASYACEAKETITYDQYIIISDTPSTEDMTNFLLDYNDELTPMTVTGNVKDFAGYEAIEDPVIVVKKDDTVYGWFIGEADGSFSFQLPEGDYSLVVETAGFDKGEPVAISDDDCTDKVLQAGDALVTVTFNLKDQNGNPLWGKVNVGEFPTVRFTGDSVFYPADENSRGKIVAQVAPGEFTATVYGEGFNFYSIPVEVEGNTNEKTTYDVTIQKDFSAPEGFVSSDVHHHTNKNDAFSQPSIVVKSVLASGLEVMSFADHDFTTNNYEGYQLAQKYDGIVGFMPSEEISCSWAHFNVIPQTEASYDYFLDEKRENHVMNQFADLQDFIDQTHEHEATITANHPFISYGLFYAADRGNVPGGYSEDYDNLEINGNTYTLLNKAMLLWDTYLEGGTMYDVDVTKMHYLVAASDTHDVLLPGSDSGVRRTYAYIGDYEGLSVKEVGLAMGQSLAAGNSFVSSGVLIDPQDKMFGETYQVYKDFNASVKVQSVYGVKDIVLLSSMGTGTYATTETTLTNVLKVTDGKGEKEVDYDISVNIPVDSQQWFAILVIDNEGQWAISNPYTAVQGTFSDVTKKHWAMSYITELQDLGVVNGYPDGSFLPDNNITRAELCQIVADLDEYVEKPENENIEYKDVKAGSWYYDAVMELTYAGIVNGYEDGTFDPNAKITREEAAVLLSRLADFAADPELEGISFKDADKIGSWAKAGVEELTEAGIINGYPDGTFGPQRNTTRAEICAMISRIL